MKRIFIALSALSVVLLAASSYDGSKMASMTKVSMKQATAIALKAYSGTITARELEKEKGGSGLRYSFVIKKGSISHEVGVDAMSGKVLENDMEGDD